MKNNITKQSQEVKTKEQPTGRKKFKMKKSVRLTIAGLLAATALVVAVIPTKGVEAFSSSDAETTIPTMVDDAISVDVFVNGNGVEPDITMGLENDPGKYWAFPCGEKIEIIQGGNTHTYYSIDTDGMIGGNVVPVFEITKASYPSTVSPSCITCYVGGEGSGYSPAGGVLKLSPTVIYAYKGEGTETYETEEIDPNTDNHTPSIWTRYTEQLIEHAANTEMTNAYKRGVYATASQTPRPYYTYDILVEKWEVPWTSSDDGSGNIIWTAPVKPDFTVVAPTNQTKIENVCKSINVGGTQKGYQLVSYIADETFKGISNFSSMEVLSEEGSANGITQIGNSAFEDCHSLNSIAFGSNFRKIGSKAFCGCTGLSSISFTNTESIGDGAFANCSVLPTISLPETLTQLGTAAFFGCSSLVDVIPDFKTDDDKNSLLFGGTKCDTGLSVGSYAFCNCTSLVQTKMARATKNIVGTHGQYGMYAGCTNLQQIELPSQTTSFKTTPSMFLGDYSLKCVRVNNNGGTAQNRQFINNINKQGSEEPTVSDDFVLWGPENYNSTAIYNFARQNSLPYMYWSSTQNKFKYIMVLEDTYLFEFTDDFVIESIKEISSIPTAENKTLRIPASIGGHPIQAIADDACGGYSGSTYITNLKLPEKIEISDAIASIGKNAFRGCESVKEVEFIHYENTATAEKTSIGESCFQDCKNLEKIKFRDDSFTRNGYYDVNIDASSVGPNAFLTQNPNGLTMLGKMEEGYWPYMYALDPNNYTCSSVADSYITYESGNPQNITCKYTRPDTSKPGYVTLLSYPTVDTVVGSEYDGSGILQDITIEDLINRYYMNQKDPEHNPPLTVNQEGIINQYTKFQNIPYGIESILGAKNPLGDDDNPPSSLDSYKNDYYIHVNDYKTKFAIDGQPYDLTTLEFVSLSSLPNVSTKDVEDGHALKPFAESRNLQSIIFDDNITDIGELPFYNFPVTSSKDEDLENAPTHTLSNVVFNGENEKETATKDDPYYWCANGIIYSYYIDNDGMPHTTIEEVLQSRGATVGQAQVSTENDPDLVNVTDIAEKAFKHCDFITSVDLSDARDLEAIPEQCFYNCNQLRSIYLPSSVNKVESEAFAENQKVLQDVYFYSKAINVDEDAFKDTYGTYCHGYIDTSIPSYVTMVNDKDKRTSADKLVFQEMTEPIYYTITFMDHLDMKELYTKTVAPGEDVATPDVPVHEGYEFTEWYSDPPKAWLNVQKSATVWARYTPTSTSSSSSSSSSSSKSTSSSGSSSSSSKSTSTSSSSKVSTSITSTTVQPVIISGTGTLVGSATSLKAAGNGTNTGSGNVGSTGSTGSSGSGNGSNIGKTKLISTTSGISDPSKMSATINGSSDNYVIKISETDEANSMADQALTAAFGSLENIRYMPFDISLYDSTGNQKISPVPDGVSINITMPIPDKLAIYGGNAKVASTESGTLEKIPPKFTLINGVPCMNFTVTHLSPYVVYVDTANLTATGTLDSTPKTADPIHPKWFLVIGLAAISGILFLKRDRKETFEAA